MTEKELKDYIERQLFFHREHDKDDQKGPIQYGYAHYLSIQRERRTEEIIKKLMNI